MQSIPLIDLSQHHFYDRRIIEGPSATAEGVEYSWAGKLCVKQGWEGGKGEGLGIGDWKQI